MKSIHSSPAAIAMTKALAVVRSAQAAMATVGNTIQKMVVGYLNFKSQKLSLRAK